MSKTATIFIRYKRKRILMNFHDYNFDWYACACKGNLVIFINKKYSSKDMSNILHQALRKIS